MKKTTVSVLTLLMTAFCFNACEKKTATPPPQPAEQTEKKQEYKSQPKPEQKAASQTKQTTGYNK